MPAASVISLPQRLDANPKTDPSGGSDTTSLSIENEGTSTLLSLRSPRGSLRLRISLRGHEPEIEILGSSKLRCSAKDVGISCEAFAVHATHSIALTCDGSIQQAAAGELTIDTGGPASVTGHAVRVRSRRGDVAIQSNDDVRVDGERIWLNR